jgi:predicted nucleic acid-binding protein
MVVDASVVTAALVDSGRHGGWARDQFAAGQAIVAPHHMPAEVTSALRRLVTSGLVSEHDVEAALAQLLLVDVELYPFEPLADRIWQLRDNLTTYDAWYVALAETHTVPLATLDTRLTSAPGPRCAFIVFE